MEKAGDVIGGPGDAGLRGPGSLDTLVPAEAVAVVATAAMWDAAPDPGEAALVARAVPKRRREFAAGRAAAREALARLGFGAAPIPARPDRSPDWPGGALGSITHCPGFCAAIAIRLGEVAGIGIDAEPDEPLPAGVGDLVLGRAERRMLAGLPSGPCWDKVVFSAKESLFKALNPLTGVFLEFRDAEIEVRPRDGGFEVSFPTPFAAFDGLTLHGRFLVEAGIVVTCLEARRGGRLG